MRKNIISSTFIATILVISLGLLSGCSGLFKRNYLAESGGSIIIYEPDVEDISEITPEDMDAAESIIRTRLDAKGMTEAAIYREEGTTIRVEIPNIEDPQEAIALIGATAKLEFLDADGNVIMDGSKKYIKGAEARYGTLSEFGGDQYYIELSFTKEGQAKFKEATAAAMSAGGDKQFISTALDGTVQMSPRVNEVIDSESCVISGDYTKETAADIANLINSGQLPFTLKEVEVRQVEAKQKSKSLFK